MRIPHYNSTLEEILVAQDVAIATYEFAYFSCNGIVTMPLCGSYVPSVDVHAVSGIAEWVVNSMDSGFPKHRDVALPVRLLAYQLKLRLLCVRLVIGSSEECFSFFSAIDPNQCPSEVVVDWCRLSRDPDSPDDGESLVCWEVN